MTTFYSKLLNFDGEKVYPLVEQLSKSKKALMYLTLFDSLLSIERGPEVELFQFQKLFIVTFLFHLMVKASITKSHQHENNGIKRPKLIRLRILK